MKRLLIAVVAAAAVAAGVVWLVGFSSVFAVRAVEVTGTALVPEVVAAAGVDATVPLARVDVAAVEARVRAIPQVAAVAIHRMPPGRLVIDVVERVPVAFVSDGDGWQLIDADAVVYLRVSDRPRLPEVRATGDGLPTAVQVAADLSPELRSAVLAIAASTRDDVRLTLRGGATVTWGSAEQSDLKSQVLTALLATKADSYDVSAPASPTTTGGLAG